MIKLKAVFGGNLVRKISLREGQIAGIGLQNHPSPYPGSDALPRVQADRQIGPAQRFRVKFPPQRLNYSISAWPAP